MRVGNGKSREMTSSLIAESDSGLGTLRTTANHTIGIPHLGRGEGFIRLLHSDAQDAPREDARRMSQQLVRPFLRPTERAI